MAERFERRGVPGSPPSEDHIVHKDKDLRILNASPVRVAKALMSGGAKPRPETKRQKAS